MITGTQVEACEANCVHTVCVRDSTGTSAARQRGPHRCSPPPPLLGGCTVGGSGYRREPTRGRRMRRYLVRKRPLHNRFSRCSDDQRATIRHTPVGGTRAPTRTRSTGHGHYRLQAGLVHRQRDMSLCGAERHLTDAGRNHATSVAAGTVVSITQQREDRGTPCQLRGKLRGGFTESAREWKR